MFKPLTPQPQQMTTNSTCSQAALLGFLEPSQFQDNEAQGKFLSPLNIRKVIFNDTKDSAKGHFEGTDAQISCSCFQKQTAEPKTRGGRV